MSETDLLNTASFLEQMLPVLVPSLIAATLIVGSLWHYWSVEIDYLMANRTKR